MLSSFHQYMCEVIQEKRNIPAFRHFISRNLTILLCVSFLFEKGSRSRYHSKPMERSTAIEARLRQGVGFAAVLIYNIFIIQYGNRGGIGCGPRVWGFQYYEEGYFDERRKNDFRHANPHCTAYPNSSSPSVRQYQGARKRGNTTFTLLLRVGMTQRPGWSDLWMKWRRASFLIISVLYHVPRTYLDDNWVINAFDLGWVKYMWSQTQVKTIYRTRKVCGSRRIFSIMYPRQ